MPNGKGGMHQSPDRWQLKEGMCPNCGQRISLRNYDKFLRCHRCHDYLAGLPILRWITHPTWVLYYIKNPIITVRDIIRLTILVAIITWLLPSAIIAGPNTDTTLNIQTPTNEDQSGVQGDFSTQQQEGSEATRETSSFNRTQLERFIWKYTNEERTQRGYNRVEYAPRVVDLAREHSRYMARHDYVEHRGPNGETGEERYESVCDYSDSGYSYGENVISGWYKKGFRAWQTDETKRFETEKELARYLVKGWMLSDGHRENILTEDWEELGVGVYKRKDGKVFASQTFC